MDHEKYYDRKSDGSYVIHFPNNKGLSKDKLQEMFSAFGNVLSVDDRGQSYGLCFVKYKNIEDVKRCISGFKNHDYIKILPHKHKAKMTNTKQRPEGQGKDQSKSKLRNGLWNHQSDINTTSLSTKSTNTSNDNGMDNEDFSDTSLSSSVRTCDDVHSIRKVPSLKHLKLKNLQRIEVNKSFPPETSTESSNKPEQLFDINEIPALVSANQKCGTRSNTKFSKLSSVVVPAQEVIVANIHPSLSIHYILHLFEKYNPIAVSLMMTTARSGIRYCHVYYKTSEDAFATVEEFDKSLLRGKNLMVLTSQKLIEEACLS